MTASHTMLAMPPGMSPSNSPSPPLSPSSWRYGIKVALTLLSALFLLGVIGVAFWYQDLRYSLPTPKPENLASVPVGSVVQVDPLLPDLSSPLPIDNRLLLLHFFNPDCPCSRFNVEHIRSLHKQYRDQVRFVAVIQTDSDLTPAEAREKAEAASRKLGGMEAVTDLDGRIAATCGVYSTPQAVVLASTRELLFRGNYNISRYCTDQKTEFARLALDGLLEGNGLPVLPTIATTAYGCELPTAPEETR